MAATQQCLLFGGHYNNCITLVDYPDCKSWVRMEPRRPGESHQRRCVYRIVACHYPVAFGGFFTYLIGVTDSDDTRPELLSVVEGMTSVPLFIANAIEASGLRRVADW